MRRATAEIEPERADVGDDAPQRRAEEMARRLARPPRRRRRLLRPLLFALGPLAVLVGGGYLYLTGGRHESTEDAYVKADVVTISAQVSGPIKEVAVRENQHVEAGDVLFRIDDRPYRVALDRARAGMSAARLEIEGLEASYRQAVAQLQLSRTNVAFAKRDYDRKAALAPRHIISEAALDEARHSLDLARHQVVADQQQITQILARLGRDPDRPVERQAAYLQAKAARDAAALDLKHTVVRAPFSGIASKTPQVGQTVVGPPMTQPVMTVIADRNLWVEANFKESDLTHVRPGQPATVEVDTYPGRVWHGTVESISPATGAEFSVVPAQNATGNWVKVVQRIAVRIAVRTEPGDPPLRAGMSTEVDIDTGHVRKLPGFVRAALGWLDGAADAMTPAGR